MREIYRIFSIFLPRLSKTEFHNKEGIWFHVASLGELYASKPLIEEFLKITPRFPILLSVFTKTAFVNALRILGNTTTVIRFPYDNYLSLKRIFYEFKPKAVVLMEKEIWPNFLYLSHSLDIPVFSANFSLNAKSYKKCKLLVTLFPYIFKIYRKIYVQREEDIEYLKKLGVDKRKVVVAGNLKFDSVLSSNQTISLEYRDVTDGDIVVTFGSVREREIKPLCGVLKRLDLRDRVVIIAPRHLKYVPLIERELKNKKIEYNLKSKGDEPEKGKVFILDTLGELRNYYRISHLVFVGGTMENYGGHNILEPISLGKPVVIGPYYWNIENIVNLAYREGLCHIVRDYFELENFLKNFSPARFEMEDFKRKSKEFIERNSGASKKIFQDILGYL